MEKQVVAVVLAAGMSRRFGNENKLLHVLPSGNTVLGSLLQTLAAFSWRQLLVVTGHEAERVAAEAKAFGAVTTFANDYQLGMGHSLAAGIKAAVKADGYLITPGDMPKIPTETITQLRERFEKCDGNTIIRPTYHGKPGHPVLFGANHRQALEQCKGDQGARHILKQHPVITLQAPIEAHTDIDHL